MSSPKQQQQAKHRTRRQNEGVVCRYGVKKRCDEAACGFVHRDEFHQKCRFKSNCKNPHCQYVHPPPPCHNSPCMTENCFFSHKFSFSLAAHVAYFLATAGKPDLLQVVKRVNSDIIVVIGRTFGELRLTHKKPVHDDDLARAEQNCRKHVRNVISVKVEVQGATLKKLKNDSGPQEIANKHGIMLYYFHGGVNIVYNKRDERATAAVPKVQEVLEALFLEKQQSDDEGAVESTTKSTTEPTAEPATESTTESTTASLRERLAQINIVATALQYLPHIPGLGNSSRVVDNERHDEPSLPPSPPPRPPKLSEHVLTLPTAKSYFAASCGARDTRDLVAGVNSNIFVVVDKKTRQLRLTAMRKVHPDVMDFALDMCRRHFEENVKRETMYAPGATREDLKTALSPSIRFANTNDITLYFFEGGVNVVYNITNMKAVAALDDVKQRVKEGQQSTTRAEQPVPVPNNDSAVTSVLKASIAALRQELRETCPDVELKLDDPSKALPTAIVSGPHDAVQRAVARIKDYLKSIIVRKINAPAPTRQMANSLRHFLSAAVSELNDDNDNDNGNGSSGSSSGEDGGADFPYIRHRVHDSFAKGKKHGGKEFLSVHLTGPPNARADLDSLAQRARDFMCNFTTERIPLKSDSQVQAFKSVEETLNQSDCNTFYNKKASAVVLSGSKPAVAEALDHLKRALRSARPVGRLLFAPTAIHARALVVQRERGPLGALRRHVASRHPDVDVSLQVPHKTHPRAIARLVGSLDDVKAAMRTAIAELEALNKDMACVPVSLSRAESQAFESVHLQDQREAAKEMRVLVLKAGSARKMLEADAAKPKSPTKKAVATCVLRASIHYGQGNECRLDVLRGDFQAVRTDAVVNPANDHLRHAGGLARAISVAAGPSFDEECQASVGRHGPVSVGSARLTGSGNLAASHSINHVVHAVAPVFNPQQRTFQKNQLAACVCRAVGEAGRQEGVRSIAIPAIGAGVFGWPANEATAAIVQGVVQAVNSDQLGSIRRVMLFDADPSKTEAFATAITEAAKAPQPPSTATTGHASMGYTAARVPTLPKYVWMWHMPEALNEWVPYDWDQQEQLEQAHAAGRTTVRLCGDRGGTPSDSRHVPTGRRYAEYDVNLKQMKQYNIVSEFARDVRRVPYRQGDPLPPLFEERRQEALRQLRQLHALQQLPFAGASSTALSTRIMNVRRTSASSDSGSAAGAGSGGSPSNPSVPSVDVPAHGFVLCGKPATVTRLAQEWRGIVDEMRETVTIAQFFKNDRVHNSRLLKLPDVRAVIDKYGIEASLDSDGNIRASYLTEQASDALLAALAKVKEKVHLPEAWTPMGDDDNLALVEVPLDSDEFEQTVLPVYSRGGFSKPVVKVERVQNCRLWDAYMHRRELLLKHSGDDNEKMLFHGTSRLDPAIITQQSFDFRVASSGMFGRGAYFAELLSYSDGSYTYSVPGTPGHKQVFIARVAAGKPEDRSSCTDIVKPSDGFDSVRGSVRANHTAYIIYETDQAYPEYLVTYRDP